MGEATHRRLWQGPGCKWLAALSLLVVFTDIAFGGPPTQATSSRAAREQAVRSIPFSEMNAESKQKISSVVNKASIYRRMPLEIMDCDPDMFLFLVRYPEVIVDIWQVMGITKCSTRRTGPYSLSGTDGMGTDCNVELVYGTDDTHVIYAEGTYDGGMFARKMSGRCVLVLKSGYSRDPSGQTYVTNRLDMFLQINNVGLDLLARTLKPLVNRTADYNFQQSARFVSRVSKLSESNGPGVQHLASRLQNIDPAVQARFSELAGVVSHRAATRQTGDLRFSTRSGNVAQRMSHDEAVAKKQK